MTENDGEKFLQHHITFYSACKGSTPNLQSV